MTVRLRNQTAAWADLVAQRPAEEILAAVEGAVGQSEERMHEGSQGDVFGLRLGGHDLVIKVARDWGPLSFLTRRMLRREARVLELVCDLDCVPTLYGLLDERFLLLERVQALPYRGAHIEDRSGYFAALLATLEEMHRRGVAHGDVKRKENLLVRAGDRPTLVDFGVAVVRRDGLAPFNHFLYDLLRQFDYNAWVKLKYNRRFEDVSEEDAVYYRRTIFERVTRWLRAPIQFVRRRVGFLR